MNATPYGFRVVGSLWESRRVVDASAAFSAYCRCDERAEVNREGYLSVFRFGDDFRHYFDANGGSVRKFDGLCCTPWLWFDIDGGDKTTKHVYLDVALADARKLAAFVVDRYKLDDAGLLLFFSGSKGFHLGLSLALAGSPPPSVMFNQIVRRLAEGIAGRAGVTIDVSVFDKVRPFRAPNARHPKTGLHKRRLTLDELHGLTLDTIRELAATPQTFDPPTPAGFVEQLAADWQSAVELVTNESQAKAVRRANGNGSAKLNRATLAFIREGATTGDRHRLLYSAAANLGELGCSFELAAALLSDAALDSGLAPRDIDRQIRCGLSAGASPSPVAGDSTTPAADSATTTNATNGTTADDLRERLAKLWTTPAAADATARDKAKQPPVVVPPNDRPATPSGSTPQPLAGDVLESLAALWDSTTTARTGPSRAAATVAPERPNAKLGPTPPPGAALFYADAKGRACSPAACELWTWEGNATWFRAAEFTPQVNCAGRDEGKCSP